MAKSGLTYNKYNCKPAYIIDVIEKILENKKILIRY